MTMLDPSTVGELRSRLRGVVLTPAQSDYEGTRRIQNGLIDRRPALIVRCSGTADVVDAGMLWLTLYDMVHHRGQLSVYLRLAGGESAVDLRPLCRSDGECLSDLT